MSTSTPELPPRPLSGMQHHLRAGGYEAIVASVGASLRVLRDADGDLIVPFAAEEMRPAMRGALLAPWPNRTADGKYSFGGREYQLPINEPDLGNAAHGLVAWLDFRVVSSETDRLRLEATIEAQPGYPWRVRVEVAFDLTEDGLRQRVTAVNECDEPAPFGVAGHPYIVAGAIRPGGADAWFLELPAREVVLVSADRLLPVDVAPVSADGGDLDFRKRRLIADAELNHAFGALDRDEDGSARVRVTDARGFGVEVAVDAACRWVQLYTTDAADPPERRHAIAVEPMTCPPDALNSKRDLIVLEPGASSEAEWRISRIRSADQAGASDSRSDCRRNSDGLTPLTARNCREK